MKLREEFNSMTQFNVNINGVSKRVSRAEFIREATFYIARGFGHYFDIPRAEALKKAKAHRVKTQKAKLALEKQLEQQHVTAQAQAGTINKLNENLVKMKKQISTAKETMDKQQQQSAEVIQENEKLKQQLEELQKKLNK